MVEMVACLIIKRSEIPYESIKQILLAEFKWADYEFCEEEDQEIIYLWNVEKKDIWQIGILLEVSQVMVGYGFGQYKNSARQEAENKLEIRSTEL